MFLFSIFLKLYLAECSEDAFSVSDETVTFKSSYSTTISCKLPIDIQNQISKIIIEEGIEEIGIEAFSDYNSITTIEFPSSLKTIGEFGFEGCSKLKKVSLTSIETLGYGSFKSCGELEEVSITSNSLTLLDSEVFYGCNSLTKLILPVSLQTISSYVFDTQDPQLKLREIIFSNTNQAIKEFTMEFSFLPIIGPAFPFIEKFTFMDPIQKLGDNLFNQCDRVVSIEFQTDGLEEIGESVFQYCYSLSEITLPSTLSIIGDSAFDSCDSLEILNICGDQDLNFGELRSNFDFVETVAFTGNVKNIGPFSFADFTLLTNLTLPQTLETIGESAFQYCESLTKIIFPKTLETINEFAFQNCISLESVTINSALSLIGSQSFSNCGNLMEFNYRSITPPEHISDDIFSGSDSLEYVSVPHNYPSDAFSNKNINAILETPVESESDSSIETESDSESDIDLYSSNSETESFENISSYMESESNAEPESISSFYSETFSDSEGDINDQISTPESSNDSENSNLTITIIYAVVIPLGVIVIVLVVVLIVIVLMRRYSKGKLIEKSDFIDMQEVLENDDSTE